MANRAWIVVSAAAVVLAAPINAAVPVPVLEWQHGGCVGGSCGTGWYTSPAVADFDGNGTFEVIGATNRVVQLAGATGAVLWRVPTGFDVDDPAGSTPVGRTWPGIVVADIDGDGVLELATAHGAGWVGVYEADGRFAAGWPQRPVTSELRSIAVGDLDRDGTAEVVVGVAHSNDVNAWVLEHNGALRPGWPQETSGGGYSWGVYADTIALADLGGSAALEIVVPSDVHYICAYDPAGNHLVADPVFGGDNWGEVGVWESWATEDRGWGMCNGVRAESYRTNFADGAATIADLDGNGSLEVVATGRTYDCTGGETTKYTGVYVFDDDRGRFVGSGYDWHTVPVDLGAPLSLDYQVIESSAYQPAVGDLDGDGEREIVLSDFSGKVHAFWLDGTQHGSWPFSVYNAGEGFFRLASEPAIADLDGDGAAEVVVVSWTQKGSLANGFLHVLSANGVELHAVPLPLPPSGSPTWNGALAAPTLANIDADPDLEVVVQTVHAGLAAWEIPGSRVQGLHWGTGRGSFLRAGTPAPRVIFADGFEIGSTAGWSATVP
jgi:hypothetical protein